MSLLDKLSKGIKSKASVSITIQNFTTAKNDIGEVVQTWINKYTFDSIFYATKSNNKGLVEKGEKKRVEGDYKTRFNLSDIDEDIANIDVSYRVLISDVPYKIEFIDVPFKDHVVLDLNLIE